MIHINRTLGQPVTYTVAQVRPRFVRIAHAAHIGEAKLIAGEWTVGHFAVPGRIQSLGAPHAV